MHKVFKKFTIDSSVSCNIVRDSTVCGQFAVTLKMRRYSFSLSSALDTWNANVQIWFCFVLMSALQGNDRRHLSFAFPALGRKHFWPELVSLLIRRSSTSDRICPDSLDIILSSFTSCSAIFCSLRPTYECEASNLLFSLGSLHSAIQNACENIRPFWCSYLNFWI